MRAPYFTRVHLAAVIRTVWVASLFSAALGRRQQRLHLRPFLVGQIARITQLAAVIGPVQE